MSFQTRIEDHVGTLASADTAFMTDVLTDGARVVIDYLVNKGSDKIEIYATDKTDAGSGIDITSGRPFSAHKSNYPARRIPVEMKAKATDADSLHYAISTDPVWYLDKTKAYVLPGGGTVRWIDYPTVLYSDSTVSNYPPEGYDTIVLYASQRYLIRILSDLTTTTIGGITAFTTPTSIVPPASPNFTYTDAIIATVGISQINFTDSLSFTPPVFGGSYTTMDTALGNQDVELAQGYNQKIQSQLGQYSQDLQKSVADFQKDLQEYQLGLQKAIENARLESQRLTQQAQLTTDGNLQNEINTLNEQVQEYQALLGKYQTEVSDYGVKIQKESARIQSLIAEYQLMTQNYLQILENLRKEFQLSLESL
jgi:hypothetical protein